MSYYDEFEAPYELYEKWTKGNQGLSMKNKHTRGPWTLDASRMILGPCFTGELKAIVDKVRGGNREESDANARLIAAAPDLAAALQAIAEPVYLNLNPRYADPDNVKTICDGMNARIDIARAALEKAGLSQSK